MRRSLLILGLLPAVLGGGAAHAQSNLLGDLIGGVIKGAAQDNARSKAQAEWSHVDSVVVDCLNKSLSSSPAQLASQGIAPSDSRVQPHIARCQRQIAAEKQKEKAAAEEQQRQEERAKLEQKARLEARQKQEEADKKAKADLQDLRSDPAIKALLTDDTVTMLIVSKEGGSFSRDLNGMVRFSRPVEGCVVASVPLSPDRAFEAYVRSEIASRFQVQLRDKVCSKSSDIARSEVMLLSGAQINAVGMDTQLLFLQAIKTKQFIPLLTLTKSDFIAAQQKRKDDMAALSERLSAGEPLYALIYSGVPVKAICLISDDKAQPLTEVLKERRSDWADVFPSMPPVRYHPDVDTLFMGLKRNECNAAFVASASVRTVLEALQRDGVSVELHPVSIKEADIAERIEAIRQQKLAAEDAAQKAAEARKAAEAERNRCRTKVVSENYFTASCVATGSQLQSGKSADDLLKTVEVERSKISSCPADVLDDVNRSAKQSARQALSQVSSLVVFEEGLAAQCRKIAVSVLP